MADGSDIVFLYRDPRTGEDYYARRVFADAWRAAGSPALNSAGRLKSVQLAARLAYERGLGSPADDPREPSKYELAHCRFVAGDIDPTPDRVRRLEAAGLVRPFSYEPWHWRVRNPYDYPIVESIPASAGGFDSKPLDPVTEPKKEEDLDMKLIQATGRGIAVVGPGYFKSLTPEELGVAVGLYGWPKDYGTNAREFDLARAVSLNGGTADDGELVALAVDSDVVIEALGKLLVGGLPDTSTPPVVVPPVTPPAVDLPKG